MTMDAEENIIAENIKGHVFELAMDSQATHVAQKALQSFSEKTKSFIIEEALDNFVELSLDQNGLCLIKKLIPECSKDKSKIKIIIEMISKNSMELIQSPYGNYSIQCVLEAFSFQEFVPILVSLKGKYAQLSMLKFSSNVIEKCIEKADVERRNEIIKEIANGDKLLGIYSI